MDLAISFANNFLVLLDAFSIYVILGLFIAGILKQIVPDDFVSSHLGKDSTSSVVKATLFGIPLPVCSCSVIPLAQGLRKEGASKGAVQSFLISTPITGVDSILATYSLFGFVFTLFRVVSSIIIAITVGLVQNFFEKESKNKIEEKIEESSCCSSSSCCDSNTEEKKSFSIIKVFKYGYGTLFSDMAKALLIGLILGALFITFMPEEYSKILFDNQFLTYIVVMLFAMPLYTCATASLPIAAALMMQGMSAGAVFIFLTAGPATSAVTMSIVYKMLGKKSLIIYIITIFILALCFGMAYDTFLGDLSLLNVSMIHEESTLIESLASLLMLVLIFYHLFKNKFKKEEPIKTPIFTEKTDNSHISVPKSVDFTKSKFSLKKD
ncbi:SO_0444 family Cu/Zn efflux transporter [Poseidonibacter lekithochrous]|uniref:SO_0444 family Cu/Zn efflux transporter n=1 Tax=Poseidonibacter lekithochrous TaxID=1904463 RepID=UPI0008FC6B66|nr:SO_0444 family Cu/Zn efflux transporter [Poseidonibacter lekithochrous]QKJ23154.1 putative permease [Poseidonibacter lekithochrous]